MNFLKSQAGPAKTLYHIVSESLQKDLEGELRYKNKIHDAFNDKYKNDRAYIIVGGIRYDNITYGYTADTLNTLLEGFELFKKEILKDSETCVCISFRKPITIEARERSENMKYQLFVRYAKIEDLKVSDLQK